MAPIRLTLYGKALSQGSKTSGAVYRKDESGKRVPVMRGGRVLTTTRDSNPKVKQWRESVAGQAREQYEGPLLEGAVIAEYVFYRTRPKAHYGTGRNAEVLKDSAPTYPTSKPDIEKLARAISDGLTGIVVADDALVVDMICRKRYCDRGDPPRVEVLIEPSPVQTVADLVAHGLVDPPAPRGVGPDQMRLDLVA